MMTNTSMLELYDRFLESRCWWGSLVCDSCGYYYSHPINYCVKCPGRIVKPNWSWFEQIVASLKKNHSYGPNSPEFREYVRKNGGPVLEYSEESEALLTELIRDRLKSVGLLTGKRPKTE